ncbi:hypothetical protein BP6252_09858 [Coleophoma cylindrospora]|uniref:Uncharacterized protein n=1 Tax=Coleophoma cylindrospora TaxID=1849047 RepID=A0A3D8QWK9_9HELO|nr:hypothetical protein BP6252_09858 [Coleophoma cylindrospora]
MSTLGGPGGRQINSKPTPYVASTFAPTFARGASCSSTAEHTSADIPGTDRSVAVFLWIMMSIVDLVLMCPNHRRVQRCHDELFVVHEEGPRDEQSGMSQSSKVVSGVSHGPDDFKNLGFKEEKPAEPVGTKESGTKQGELRW